MIALGGGAKEGRGVRMGAVGDASGGGRWGWEMEGSAAPTTMRVSLGGRCVGAECGGEIGRAHV